LQRAAASSTVTQVGWHTTLQVWMHNSTLFYALLTWLHVQHSAVQYSTVQPGVLMVVSLGVSLASQLWLWLATAPFPASLILPLTMTPWKPSPSGLGLRGKLCMPVVLCGYVLTPRIHEGRMHVMLTFLQRVHACLDIWNTWTTTCVCACLCRQGVLCW
jgi:hypothetical protein